MLQDSRWLFVPAGIVLGSLYGVLHALPPSTEPPRAQAATGAAAAFGLLSLFFIHTSNPAYKAKALLAVLLLAVLVYSVYRIEDHVQQAGCSSDKEEVSYVMAGGGDFHTFVSWSCFSLAFVLVCICCITCIGVMDPDPFNDKKELKWLLMAWLTTVIIGLACASGGQYRCSTS